MNGRRAVVGLCMLCALLISAFAAQSASAVNGTTAYTCKKVASGTGDFTKAHCTDADTGVGDFDHVEIAQDKTTEVEITSDKTDSETKECTNSVFKSTIGGIGTTLTTCDVHGTGWMENKVEGKEHYSVSHVTLTFTEVDVNHAGCNVWTHTENAPPNEMGEKGVVHTKPLRVTTKGQGDSVKIEPTEGTVIARFWLTECNTAAFNGTYTVSGSLTCVPDGATIDCDHTAVTTQNLLKLNGAQKAGQDGKITVTGRANSGEEFTPLSTTTVETA